MARDIARNDAYLTSRHQRKKAEMLFARLNGSCVLIGYGYEVPAVVGASATLPPPPRTSAGSPS